MDTLVLNCGSVPVSVVPHRRAIVLVECKGAVPLETYERTYSISNETKLIPSVIQCVHSKYIPKNYTNVLPFNRRNVYIRDAGHCMYCGKKVSLSNFTFDHVIPRCEGGETCWTNIVVSCMRCNSHKGRKSVKNYKRLIRKPFAPKLDKAAPKQLVNKIASEEIQHETWSDYIYWNVILEP